MNRFERMVAEKVSLIITLAFAINRQGDLFIHHSYTGSCDSFSVYAYEAGEIDPFQQQRGMIVGWTTYLRPEHQFNPSLIVAETTLDQMIDLLQAIYQAGNNVRGIDHDQRNKPEHSDHSAATPMDARRPSDEPLPPVTAGFYQKSAELFDRLGSGCNTGD